MAFAFFVGKEGFPLLDLAFAAVPSPVTVHSPVTVQCLNLFAVEIRGNKERVAKP
jgi:hypothetical protein